MTRRTKTPAELVVRTHYVSNHCGWELELRQCFDPHRLRKDLRPIMILPGYGMNNFIFRYNPTDISMEAAWAGAGFDVWSVNLRGQGGSRRRGGDLVYDLRNVVSEDVPAAIEGICKHTVSNNKGRVDAVGASLGGSFLYAYLAVTKEPKLGAMVAVGAPLRWEKINPILKGAFAVPELLGRIPFYGTQQLARVLFPVVARFPFLLRVYLHPELVDPSALGELTKAIENPVPRLNRQIGYWIRHKDLVLDGVNVTQALANRTNPLLCVIANHDGIVTRETALSATAAMGSTVCDVMEVGTDRRPYAHADLFISHEAGKKVFQPIAEWLLSQEDYQS